MEFTWDENKNALLKERRGVTFEDIVSEIDAGKLVRVLKHPDQLRYPDQELYLVNHNNYIHVIPVVMGTSSKTAQMKTIYPSRKYNREYLQQEERI